MTGRCGSVRRVRLIAGQTFLEAVRQRFFAVLVLVSCGLILVSRFFESLDFGGGGAKFLVDFGFGGIVFFGSILGIVATAQLFFSEIENRTVLTLLAKPVGRFEFLCGKLLGTLCMLAAFVVVLTGTLWLLLLLREGGDLRYGDLVVFALLQVLRLGVLAAITLFIASYARTTLFAILASFFVLLICQLQYVALDAYAAQGGGASIAAQVLALVFPNFQLFNVADLMLLPERPGLDATTLLRIAVYGVAYVPVFLLLAYWNFCRREI